MARIFITGSTSGLGRAAAQKLIDEGHDVIVHARSRGRAADIDDLASRAAGVVIGDLSGADETQGIVDQLNELGRMDAVIHNAGVMTGLDRSETVDGHPAVMAVNILAPFIITALTEWPDRLIFLSSSMQSGSLETLGDIDWTERRWNGTEAYSESKLYVATLALAIARHRPSVLSNAVDPGWVPTGMGGPSATDDLEEGSATQTWLASSDDVAAKVGGHFWYHRQQRSPAREAADAAFQDRLVERLCNLTGVSLF